MWQLGKRDSGGGGRQKGDERGGQAEGCSEMFIMVHVPEKESSWLPHSTHSVNPSTELLYPTQIGLTGILLMPVDPELDDNARCQIGSHKWRVMIHMHMCICPLYPWLPGISSFGR